MANITLDKLKTIVQSIVASVTRYKPNLSVNDPDDPRYVAGRLCYKATQTVEEVPETTVTFAENNGLYMSPDNLPMPGVQAIGDVRTVVWDGVAYVCKAGDYMGEGFALGNRSLYNAMAGESNPDTGEPFVWAMLPKYGIYGLMTLDAAETHTVSCWADKEVVHTLPKEYLPQIPAEKVQGFVEVEATANAAKTTAETAKTTAETAKNTANAAKTTATNAQNTANAAQTTANAAKTTATNAQNTANAAQTTANAAKTTAETAKTTAETAKTTANAALPQTGGNLIGYLRILPSKTSTNPAIFLGTDGRINCAMLDLEKEVNGISGKISIRGAYDDAPQVCVGRSKENDIGAPAILNFIANGASGGVHLEGTESIELRSPNGNKYKLTVDDSGTLSATAVTEEATE